MIKQREVNMNNKIKMAVVGLVFGRYIVEQQILSGPGSEYIELAGVCDLDEKLSSELAIDHRVREYKDLDEILSDSSIEAVGLFTGPNGRATLIKKIIRAGKHVMTTKPFEVNAEAALDVLKEAKELKKVVHLNSPGPLPASETEQIIQWTHEFKLGRQVSFNWETYANYYQKADGTWYDDPEKCPVAPIFRLGIYGINKIIRLFGNVDQVGVISSRIRTARPTPDNAILSLLFKNGVVGSVHASFCVKNGYLYPDNLTVNYERGTIKTTAVETDSKGDTSAIQVALQTVDSNDRIITRKVRFDKEELTGKYQWGNFHKAVKSGLPLHGEIIPEQIVAGIQVINAMAEADKTGKNVNIKEIEASKEHVS